MFENVYVIIKYMQEGQEANGGLGTGKKSGGVFDSNNQTLPTELSSFANKTNDVRYVADDGDGRKKSKKWLIGGIVFGVL